MTSFTHHDRRHFITDAAIDPNLRVKLNATNELVLAGATDLEVGTTLQKSTGTANESVEVLLVNASGTTKGISAGAIALGAGVYAAASGQVAATGNIRLGRALSATTGAGQEIEFIRDEVGFVQSVTPDDAQGTINTILPGVQAVEVGAVTNNANDFIVLPALDTVPVGWQINIACNAGGGFEMRTPADSDEPINNVNCDGTQEYACTDDQLIRVYKVSNTDGWVASALTNLGAVATAVVPD